MKDISAYLSFRKEAGLPEDYWSLVVMLATTPVVLNAFTSFLLYTRPELLKYKKSKLENPETLLAIGAVKDLLEELEKESSQTKQAQVLSLFPITGRLTALAWNYPIPTLLLGIVPPASHRFTEEFVIKPLRKRLALSLLSDAKAKFQNELRQTLELLIYIQQGKLSLEHVRKLSEPKRLALLAHLYIMTGKNYAEELGLSKEKADKVLNRKFEFVPAGEVSQFSDSPSLLKAYYDVIEQIPMADLRQSELEESSADLTKKGQWWWAPIILSGLTLAIGVPYFLYRGAFELGRTLSSYSLLATQEETIKAIESRIRPYERLDLSKYISPPPAYFAYLRRTSSAPSLEKIYQPPPEDVDLSKTVSEIEKLTKQIEEEEKKEMEEAIKRREALKRRKAAS